MAFSMFPKDTDQLVLAHLQPTGMIPFNVPPTADSMFLRLITIGPDCEPFGVGAPPIIELRAGTSRIMAVPAAPEEVVFKELGQDVATAHWTREEPQDIFTVEITILESAIRPWRVRFINADPQPLGFVWVTSTSEANTRQPRVSLDGRRFVQGVGAPRSDFTLEVANIGTGDLKFSDTADTDVGGGFILKEVPRRIEPNGCATLKFSAEAAESSQDDVVIPYVIGSNLGDDTERETGTITLVQVGPPPVDPKDHEKDHEKDSKDAQKDGAIDKPGHPPEYTAIDGPLDADFLSGVGEERLTSQLVELQRNISQLAHFIPAALRPDLASRFLEQEAETGTENREPPCG
ncbi:hypothetical protein BJ965_006992 [Streptomyces luteogriseus]|uniref:Uncharacterized protein n=1 Tax=Streptomyces luteogriseus TaxID=68233 RepID=A0A7W7GLV6_9ACTN|nr:hypothetical protein [Streptomyces luteogriseus]MBB4717110.1 hypothetical protein [Streptomyces luteogriseus]